MTVKLQNKKYKMHAEKLGEHQHEHDHDHEHDHGHEHNHQHDHEHEHHHEHHEHGTGLLDDIGCSCGHCHIDEESEYEHHEHEHHEHDHEHHHEHEHHHDHEHHHEHHEHGTGLLDDIGCTCGHCHIDEESEHGHEHHHNHEHHHDHEHHHGHGEDGLLDDVGCTCGHCSAAELSEPAHSRRRAFSIGRLFGSIANAVGRVPLLWRIGIAIALFLMGIFVNRYIFIASYIVAGSRVVFTSLRKINAMDEFFLMTVASLGALAIGEFPEAAAVMILFEIGEYFTDRAVGKSKSAIAALLELRPNEVTVLRDGSQIVTEPEDVRIGESILVKPGERVALDGVLVSEAIELDTSAVTGESVPMSVKKGEAVLSGSVVIGRPITVEVTKRYSDSTIAKIIALVQNAKDNKTGTERFISRFAKVYTPSVVLLSLAIIFIPSIITGFANFSEWLHRGLIFLVVSCPCALVISVPLGYFAGIGKASSSGILFKGSTYLEAIAHADRIVFDKTGTLTKGEFEVFESSIQDPAVHQMVALIERGSTHPLAKAILDYTEGASSDLATSQAELPRLVDTLEIPGSGLKAKFERDGETLEVLVGNQRLLSNHGLEINAASEPGDNTHVYVSVNGDFAGSYSMKDKLRNDAKESIQGLKQLMKTTLLSGDRESSVSSTASELGIDEYRASMLPEDKYSHVKSHVDSGEKVIFVGDGINDAPVLAGADIGIAMGLEGSDAAIEAADAVLMKTGLGAILTAIDISKFTKSIVMQNIVIALAIKFTVLVLGALGMANMWMAVIADVGAALLAVLNTLRITAKKF